MKLVKLANGLRIANFSSPHPFMFVSGEVLEACEKSVATTLVLEVVEESSQHAGGWTDISLSFRMSPAVKEALDTMEQDPSIDIVLVPLPVMAAIKEAGQLIGKARVCRTADRVLKTIYSDRFCV